MAGAMLDGWLAGGIDPQRFTVMDPARKAVPDGVELVRELPSGGAFDAILLGVKPQILKDVAPAVEPLCTSRTVMLSLLAGVELATLQRYFPRAAGHVRVMPNLAVALGKAPIALAETGLDEAARGELIELMQVLGTPEWVGEGRFDLVTALAGSGPAFVYRFIDGLAQAAVRLGLPEDQARALAVAMTEGAAALAASSAHPPGKLADMVASPGGVTRAGLDVLDNGDAMAELLFECLRAARDRSAQMSREARD